MSTPKELIPALRQYQHNDESGLLIAYDRELTERLVINFKVKIEKLEHENKQLHTLLGPNKPFNL